MKFTNYFKIAKQRPDRIWIKEEWIEQTLKNPGKVQMQNDGRLRFWKKIEDADGRYLRVIVLEDRETVHNVFFDRSMEEDNENTILQ